LQLFIVQKGSSAEADLEGAIAAIASEAFVAEAGKSTNATHTEVTVAMFPRANTLLSVGSRDGGFGGINEVSAHQLHVGYHPPVPASLRIATGYGSSIASQVSLDLPLIPTA